MLERKATQVKQTTRGNKPEDSDERKRTKKIGSNNTNKIGHSKTTKKIFNRQVGVDCTKSYEQPDDKDTKQF